MRSIIKTEGVLNALYDVVINLFPWGITY